MKQFNLPAKRLAICIISWYCKPAAKQRLNLAAYIHYADRAAELASFSSVLEDTEGVVHSIIKNTAQIQLVREECPLFSDLAVWKAFEEEQSGVVYNNEDHRHFVQPWLQIIDRVVNDIVCHAAEGLRPAICGGVLRCPGGVAPALPLQIGMMYWFLPLGGDGVNQDRIANHSWTSLIDLISPDEQWRRG